MRAAIIEHFRKVGAREMNGLTAARLAEMVQVVNGQSDVNV